MRERKEQEVTVPSSVPGGGQEGTLFLGGSKAAWRGPSGELEDPSGLHRASVLPGVEERAICSPQLSKYFPFPCRLPAGVYIFSSQRSQQRPRARDGGQLGHLAGGDQSEDCQGQVRGQQAPGPPPAHSLCGSQDVSLQFKANQLVPLLKHPPWLPQDKFNSPARP